MFVELIDTFGKKRFINPAHVQEVRFQEHPEPSWKVIFAYNDGCSHFTEHNIDKLLGQENIHDK